MTENEIAKHIVDVVFKNHTTYGPGLYESGHETLMAYELQKRGLPLRRQQGIPLGHEAIKLDLRFRADLIVEDRSSLKSSRSMPSLLFIGNNC